MFACTTKGEKVYIDDSNGGMLLMSNTEAPGEEVVRSVTPISSLFFMTISQCMCGSSRCSERLPSPSLPQKSAHLLTIPPTCDSVDGSLKKGFLDRMGATSPVSLHQSGQQMSQHLIDQQMSQKSFYQRDFMSQGQNGYYSSRGYGGATYTDAAMLKQSQLSALYTWETNGIYLDKVTLQNDDTVPNG